MTRDGKTGPGVFGVAGWKNSGKTTLVERLVAELVARGRRVATVKHAHHDFEVDREETDSWRHRQAGAIEVAIVSERRYAVIGELRGAPEPTLAEMLARLSPCDIVIVEGYKRETHAKIEVRRMQARDTRPLWPDDPAIVAVAADHAVEAGPLPVFDLDDIARIADFVGRASGLAEPPDV